MIVKKAGQEIDEWHGAAHFFLAKIWLLRYSPFSKLAVELEANLIITP